jgi:hypothetical protein
MQRYFYDHRAAIRFRPSGGGNTSGQLFFAVPLSAQQGQAATLRWLGAFGDVFERVRTFYVEQPDDLKLIEAASNALIRTLDGQASYAGQKSFLETRLSELADLRGAAAKDRPRRLLELFGEVFERVGAE